MNELVGRINGRFGTVEFMPIHYLHKSVPIDELTAMYALADACLVTSTRDGMNLVSAKSGLRCFGFGLAMGDGVISRIKGGAVDHALDTMILDRIDRIL